MHWRNTKIAVFHIDRQEGRIAMAPAAITHSRNGVGSAEAESLPLQASRTP